MTSNELLKESPMTKTAFVYVTYIASTPQRVWDALLKPEFTREYWRRDNVSDWNVGSRWEHRKIDGEVQLVGKVIENDPPRRMVISWSQPSDENDTAKHTRVTFEIAPVGNMVQLTVTHDMLDAGSDMDRGIRIGWPRVLSSLKTLLEVGKALDTWAGKQG